MSTWKTKLINPLRSRKIRTALATVLVAFLAEWGLDISDEKLYAIISVGVAVILGIAIEDNGAKGGTEITVSTDKVTAELTAAAAPPATGHPGDNGHKTP